MKNIRKALSVFLSLLVIASAFSVVAFAEECNHLYSATSVPPTCADSGYTFYVCQYCGDNYRDYDGAPALGHVYGEWKTLQAETCVDEGFYQRDCTRCGSSQVKTVSVIPHADTDSDGKCDYCSEATGSQSTVSPFDWLVALFNFFVQWFRDIFA